MTCMHRIYRIDGIFSRGHYSVFGKTGLDWRNRVRCERRVMMDIYVVREGNKGNGDVFALN